MSKAWPMVKLGEVLTERKEMSFSDDIESGNIRIVSKIGFNGGNIELRSGFETKTGMILVRPGDFVVSGINAAKGAIAIYGEENTEPIAATIHYGAYIPNKNRVDTRFLWWLLRSHTFRDLLTEYVPGGIKTELKAKRLLPIPVPLPPLSEQKRITARLEELSAKIEEARGLRQEAVEEAEALIQSSLHDCFVIRSANWTLLPMEEAIEINDKQVDPTLPEYSQLPHISGENMESKTCRLLPWRTAKEDGVKSNNYLFSPGTILYSKIRPYLRKAVYVDFRGVCSADIYPIRINNPSLDPHFVKWMLVAEPFSNYANRLSGRTRMPKLNRKQLFGFSFSHPPLIEQRRIVAYLDGLQTKVDALKRLQTETASELYAMLPSVLDRAFKGVGHMRDSFYKELSRGTTLERPTKTSVAELAAIAYPATDADRTICAAALAVVEQSGGLSSLEHLDALLLATHPDWCKKFLNQQDQHALDTAIHSAPMALFVDQDQSIRWKECRDYLEDLGAITVVHGATDQPIHTGAAMANIKAGLPTGTDDVVKYALAAVKRVTDLHKNLSSVPQAQRYILDAFTEQHRQYKLTA